MIATRRSPLAYCQGSSSHMQLSAENYLCSQRGYIRADGAVSPSSTQRDFWPNQKYWVTILMFVALPITVLFKLLPFIHLLFWVYGRQPTPVLDTAFSAAVVLAQARSSKSSPLALRHCRFSRSPKHSTGSFEMTPNTVMFTSTVGLKF